MQDVQDEPLFCERVAGLDIAKAEVEVTIRVPSDTTPGRRQQETRTFGTTRRELESLGDWLACWGVTKVGMEATGDYWKPVFFLLESRGFDCELYNAAQVKALPGRPKTDRADSIWLAKITERGIGRLQLRAARADPPAAHPHPLPPSPHPGPHRREAAGGEAARRRAPEAVQRDLRHPRRLGPGHAGRDRRRAARPAGRWPSWPAAPCAARSAGWKRRWTARSSPTSTPPCWR